MLTFISQAILYNSSMSIRKKLGSKLFDLAAKAYPKGQKGDTLRKEVGNLLFKLAAKVSPDKK